MTRTYPREPALGVGAVVFRDAAVLLVRRARPPLEGEWSLPGGRVELGETVEEAVIREVHEETGWWVTVEEPLGVFDYIERDDAGRVRYHYILNDFLCRYLAGELVSGSDVSAVELAERERIDRYRLTANAMRAIDAGWKKWMMLDRR